MFIKNYHLTFIFLVIIGSILAISCSSWFTCWLGLELNLISIIPLILIKFNKNSTETAIKYFLPQVVASTLIIFYSILEINNFNQINSIFFNAIISIALSIKAGLAPFHFWFPQVTLNREWIIILILLTWQKIAPFILLSTIISSNNLFILILFSALTGGIGGFNQNLIKLILTFSSIVHGAWIIRILNFRILSWINYFLIYSFITLGLIIQLFIFNINKISHLTFIYLNNFIKIAFIISVISLGGLPPFLGFLAKINAILILFNRANFIIALLLVIGSLISLFFYMKIIYRNIFLINPHPKINYYNPIKLTYLNPIIFFIITGNLLSPLLVSLT